MIEPAVLSNWLRQMASGALASGVTIEYGTTIARFVLNTVTLPASERLYWHRCHPFPCVY
jgi:hypothetical protein